jgi:hypothetical protein
LTKITSLRKSFEGKISKIVFGNYPQRVNIMFCEMLRANFEEEDYKLPEIFWLLPTWTKQENENRIKNNLPGRVCFENILVPDERRAWFHDRFEGLEYKYKMYKMCGVEMNKKESNIKKILIEKRIVFFLINEKGTRRIININKIIENLKIKFQNKIEIEIASFDNELNFCNIVRKISEFDIFLTVSGSNIAFLQWARPFSVIIIVYPYMHYIPEFKGLFDL